MKQSFYIKHDNTASQDPKLIKVRLRHGWAGIGIFWAIIEALDRNSGKMEYDLDILTEMLSGVKPDVIQSIIQDFGLFAIHGGMISSGRLNRDRGIREEAVIHGAKGGKSTAQKKTDKPPTPPLNPPLEPPPATPPLKQGEERRGEEKEESKEEPPLPPVAVAPEEPEEPEDDRPLDPFIQEFKKVYPNPDGIHHAEMAFARCVVEFKVKPEVLVEKARQYAGYLQNTDPTQKMFKCKNWLEGQEWKQDYRKLWKAWKEQQAKTTPDEKPYYKPIVNQ